MKPPPVQQHLDSLCVSSTFQAHAIDGDHDIFCVIFHLTNFVIWSWNYIAEFLTSSGTNQHETTFLSLEELGLVTFYACFKMIFLLVEIEWL